MDILSMLKNMDKDTLEKGLKEASAFLSTPEGKNLAQKLSSQEVSEDVKKAVSDAVNDKSGDNPLGELLKKAGLKS